MIRVLLLLLGQINLHKNKQTTPTSEPHAPDWATRRASPYGLRRGRGGRGGHSGFPHSHRNRSLVLNSSSNSTLATNLSFSGPHDLTDDLRAADSTDTAPATNWIAKHDRHRQLINPSIYEREMNLRARDMEETRKLKAQRRDEREKLKINRHLQRLATQSRLQSASQSSADPSNTPYDIFISGIRFLVADGGGKLVKKAGSSVILCCFWGRVYIMT